MDREQRVFQPTFSSIIDRMNEILKNIGFSIRNRSLNSNEASNEISSLIRNLERLRQNVAEQELTAESEFVGQFDTVLASLKSLGTEIEKDDIATEPLAEDQHRHYGSRLPAEGRGPPAYSLDIEKLQQLIQMGFSLSNIARDGLLGGKMHRNTLSNHLKRNGITRKTDLFHQTSDEELKAFIRDYNIQFPNSGAGEIVASLQSRGIKVSRSKVRNLLAEVDPVGTASRWSTTVQRRKYSVPNSNAVWHIDTHHSLKRWGIFVHGGIDGFSRLVPYLRASSTITAKASLSFFVKAVEKYGVPSRARADSGTELVDIGRFLTKVNGEGRGSIMTGKSVHNQRIERLWRDVYSKVLQAFYRLFYHMEDHNILDITNEEQMFSLQFVFLPRIDAALNSWRITHNHHKLRTEAHKTPEQLWTQSILHREQEGASNTALQNLFQPPQEKIEQAVQELSDGQGLDDSNFVYNPRFPVPVSEENLVVLRETVNVHRPSEASGIDIYIEVLEFISCTNNH